MKTAKRWFALLVSLALVCVVMGVPAAAAGSIKLPQLPSDKCVVDDAGVLSDETEQYLDSLNGALQQQCDGATIAVLTVKQLGNTTTEEYAREAMKTWGVGSKSAENGVLLFLAMETPEYSDGDYYLAYGKGLAGSDLAKQASTIVQSGESDFAAGRYDTYVKSTVDQAAQVLANQYGVTLSAGTAGENAGQQASGWNGNPEAVRQSAVGSIVGGILSLLLIVVILILLFAVIIAPIGRGFGWAWGPFGWGWGPFGWFGRPHYRRPRRPRGPRGPRPPRGGGFGGGFGGDGFGGMGGGGSFGGGAGRGGFGGGGFGGGGFGGMGGGGGFGGGAGRGR